MSFIQSAMNRTLIYYIAMIIIIVALALLCFLKHKSNKMTWIGIGLCFALIVYIFLFVPFISDYIHGNVVETVGYYEYELAGKSNSLGNAIGMITVTLQTDGETLNLTTAPGKRDLFELPGKPYVKAYYLSSSKILLHIEVLELNSSPRDRG